MEKIDIRQMRVLVLLVRYKSVSRVAELLEISQQGVSSHLKKLRDLFPAELFIRQSAGLQPTDYACELPPGSSRSWPISTGSLWQPPSIPPAASAPSG
ncbi:LysR family transcriptional regulator [Aeromonas veronii]